MTGPGHGDRPVTGSDRSGTADERAGTAGRSPAVDVVADGGRPVGRPRVKICGLTSAEDRDVTVAAGADAVGFVAGVTVDTPRDIGLEAARDLVAGAPPFATTVLVTMPADAATARERIERVRPDAVQLHGADADLAAALTDAPARVVAAVGAASDASALREYADAADALLVDSADADGGGGTGETHDWERTRERVAGLDVPVVLAGGLTPDNVAAAVATVDPFGVDVATGVEAAGGVKDHDAVRRFVENARREVTTA